MIHLHHDSNSRFVGKPDMFVPVAAVLTSPVRAAWPATRPAHSFLKFRAYPLNVLPSGFRFLDGDNPADPLIAREWRNILPFCSCHRSEMRTFCKSAGTLQRRSLSWSWIHSTSLPNQSGESSDAVRVGRRESQFGQALGSLCRSQCVEPVANSW